MLQSAFCAEASGSQTRTDLQLSCSFYQKCVCLPAPQHTPPAKAWVFLPSHALRRHKAFVFKDRVDQSRSLFVQNKHKTLTQKCQGPRLLKELEAKTRTYLPWKTYGCVPCASAVPTQSRTLQLSTRCWRGRPHLSVKVSQGVAKTTCQARVSAASLLERVPSSGAQSEVCVFLYG